MVIHERTLLKADLPVSAHTFKHIIKAVLTVGFYMSKIIIKAVLPKDICTSKNVIKSRFACPYLYIKES